MFHGMFSPRFIWHSYRWHSPRLAHNRRVIKGRRARALRQARKAHRQEALSNPYRKLAGYCSQIEGMTYVPPRA